MVKGLLNENAEESEILSKMLFKEMSFNSSNIIKENYEINSFKIPAEFKEKITFLQMFKNLIDRKLLAFGLYRKENEKSKNFFIIPNGSEILKVILLFLF